MRISRVNRSYFKVYPANKSPPQGNPCGGLIEKEAER
jgi:hypothetical protein